MKITVDGTEYDVAHQFTPERAIINYDGVYALVDKVGGTWELSGQPALPYEKPVLDKLTAPMTAETIVTVTPPEE